MASISSSSGASLTSTAPAVLSSSAAASALVKLSTKVLKRGRGPFEADNLSDVEMRRVMLLNRVRGSIIIGNDAPHAKDVLTFLENHKDCIVLIAKSKGSISKLRDRLSSQPMSEREIEDLNKKYCKKRVPMWDKTTGERVWDIDVLPIAENVLEHLQKNPNLLIFVPKNSVSNHKRHRDSGPSVGASEAPSPAASVSSLYTQSMGSMASGSSSSLSSGPGPIPLPIQIGEPRSLPALPAPLQFPASPTAALLTSPVASPISSTSLFATVALEQDKIRGLYTSAQMLFPFPDQLNPALREELIKLRGLCYQSEVMYRQCLQMHIQPSVVTQLAQSFQPPQSPSLPSLASQLVANVGGSSSAVSATTSSSSSSL
jgi:hypothetical protein